jgi:predicted 3-demethylubiquinone-9 3-methyltransferase (glyoxalase superfamily)
MRDCHATGASESGSEMSIARRKSMTTFHHKITPHLWFDQEAREAAEFYVAAFGNGSQITHSTTLHDTPSGDAESVSFELAGQPFMAISAGV